MRVGTMAGLLLGALLALQAAPLAPAVAIRGEAVFTMAGPSLAHGVVVIRDGKIVAIGPASEVDIPAGMTVLDAAVVTPGLIDAHTTVGLSGLFNNPADQDQLQRSEQIQPELRDVEFPRPVIDVGSVERVAARGEDSGHIP